MSETQSRFDLKLELIMQRAVASAIIAALLALPLAASADDAPTAPAAPDAQAAAARAKATAAVKPPAASAHDATQPNSGVAPVAITAKRTHPRLDLRLTSDRLNRVLDDSGVEPVAEADPAIDAIEVTARRVQDEPITPGIPAIYYGITHPTEAWRIFAPIQP
jgi:hypothetical protein